MATEEETSSSLKEAGNAAFKDGNFEEAHRLFASAIEKDPENSVLYCNRSMCDAALQRWQQSLSDATTAVRLNSKYEKAYYRAVKALISLGLHREAARFLLVAIRECGETKGFKSLEQEYFQECEMAVRPKPYDFDVMEELGDGNFSKIMKARYKPTGKIFAIKVIEKTTVTRMKRRHPNIENEIMMEKRALNKLDHPNIINLYATFQDMGTLYYQMEFMTGGELWSRLQDKLTPDESPMQVGCHYSLAVFYFAEILNAVEYMHRRGIVHRDIKPENILIGIDGHIKMVDFGTAKDMIQTDLNGPEFVGTAEYMSPLAVNSKPCGYEADLWAMGILLHQMLLGYTAFAAASPYLTFLRIKKAMLKLPEMIANTPAADLMSKLLTLDAEKRFAIATAPVAADSTVSLENLQLTFSDETPSKATPNYNALRSHPFFSTLGNRYEPLCAPLPQGCWHSPSLNYNLSNNNSEEVDAKNPVLSQIEAVASAHLRPAVRIPTLRELCLRQIAAATVQLAEDTAACGGVRPDTAFAKSFDLQKLTALDRAHIAHYLTRHNKLHIPGVYRLFCKNVVDARTCRVDPFTREYIGFNRSNQGQWESEYYFSQLANPQVGAVSSDPSLEMLKAAVSGVNKLRPRFLVTLGNFVSVQQQDEQFGAATENFRRALARVSDTIPVLFVPGENDVGQAPTADSLASYRRCFGADYYGFWYGGIRCLVLNSPLLCHSENVPEEGLAQEKWFAEEIEQAKLCSSTMMIFSYHSWRPNHCYHAEHHIHHNDPRYFPTNISKKWVKKLRHTKIKFLCSSAGTGSSYPIGNDGNGGGSNCLAFPRARRLAMINSSPKAAVTIPSVNPAADDANESNFEDLNSAKETFTEHTPDIIGSEEPLLPSQIIANSTGVSDSSDSESEDEVESPKDDANDDANDANDANDKLVHNEPVEDDSSDEKEGFVNEDTKYEGPTLVVLPSVSIDNANNRPCSGVAVVEVTEYESTLMTYSLDSIPRSYKMDSLNRNVASFAK